MNILSTTLLFFYGLLASVFMPVVVFAEQNLIKKLKKMKQQGACAMTPDEKNTWCSDCCKFNSKVKDECVFDPDADHGTKCRECLTERKWASKVASWVGQGDTSKLKCQEDCDWEEHGVYSEGPMKGLAKKICKRKL